MNRYFKTSDAKNFAFYKVPKALFEEKYKSVSTDAKMLYGLLLDRMYLSVKNGWIDKQGRVYQYNGKSKTEKCGEIRLNKEKGVTPLSGLHHNSLNTALLARG